MLELNFTPFPVLTTERLKLRKLDYEDDQEIFILRNDERVNQFLDRPKTPTITIARNFINKINSNIRNNESIMWALTIKDQPKLIGTIGLWNFDKESSKAEIGYELLPDYHGQGIMHEAMIEVIEFGFKELKLKFIEAHVTPDNAMSIKLLEKNNFKRQTMDSHNNDEHKVLVVYGLTNSMR